MFLNYMYTELIPLMHASYITYGISVDPSYIILQCIRTRKFLFDLKKQQKQDSFIRHKLLKDFEKGEKTLNDCISIMKEKSFKIKYMRAFNFDVNPKDTEIFENLIKREFESEDKDDYNVIFQKVVKFFVLDLDKVEIKINKFNQNKSIKRRNQNVLDKSGIDALKKYAKKNKDQQILDELNKIFTN